MDFRNMSQSELTLEPVNRNDNILKCPVPPELRENLRIKKVGIQEMVVDTSKIPKFVPQVAYPYGAQSITFYKGGSSNDSIVPPPEQLIINQDALQYFINYRANDNSKCITSVVMWNDPNNLPVPNSSVVDSISVYSLPYYHCYNFMDFLTMVQLTINNAIATNLGNPIPAGKESLFKYDASTKTFQLTVCDEYVTNHKIEISQSLQDIFRFQSAQINAGFLQSPGNPDYPYNTYQITFNDIFAVGSNTFYQATNDVKNTIFPFDLCFITTNLPVPPVTFINSADQNIGEATKFNILHKFRIKGNVLEMNEYLDIAPTNVVNRLKTLLDDSFNSQHLTFSMYFRTRVEHEFIKWTFPIDEEIDISLVTYNVI